MKYKVKRYWCIEVDEHEEGSYIQYDDYAAKMSTAIDLIERSRDALPGYLVGLRASLEAFLEENREEEGS